MRNIINLANHSMAATVTCRGGELLQLTCNGKDLLWDRDTSIWDGSAQILFPVIGRTEKDEIRVDGQTYPMPMHGFAKDSTFILVDQTATSCTLELASSAATERHYPFLFALRLTYALSETGLRLSVEIVNRGQALLPASFGFHPGFRWPLVPNQRKEDHRLTFSSDKALTYTRPKDRLVGSERQQLVLDIRTLHLHEDLFATSGMVFLAPESRSVRFHTADETASIELEYKQMGQLILWMRPGSDFLCIEPCYGHSDPLGFAGDFFDKPCLAMIEPGQSLHLSIAIKPLFG